MMLFDELNIFAETVAKNWLKSCEKEEDKHHAIGGE